MFSHQPGAESARLSGGVARLAINFFRVFDIEVDEIRLHGIIRAMAHFTIFFVLGLLWYITFRFRGISPNRAAIMAFCSSFAYALFDEGHQYFIPGRACDIRDVLVDSLGAGTAIFIGWAIPCLQT